MVHTKQINPMLWREINNYFQNNQFNCDLFVFLIPYFHNFSHHCLNNFSKKVIRRNKVPPCVPTLLSYRFYSWLLLLLLVASLQLHLTTGMPQRAPTLRKQSKAAAITYKKVRPFPALTLLDSTINLCCKNEDYCRKHCHDDADIEATIDC
jgi:hypothetical protein